MKDLTHKPLISIIVPIYNAQSFIERAIKSVLAQTYENWELLLIDDGSTDNSLMECQRIATTDSRIKVFHKENGGEADARNFGLDHCIGDYICHIDADDHVSPHYIGDLIGENPKDISICGIQMKWGSRREDIPANKSNTNTNIFESLILSDLIIVGSSCNKLFKRNIIEDNHLRYPTDQQGVGVDHVFNWRYFQHCKTIRIVDNLNYIYEENPDSVSHERSADNPIGFSKARLNFQRILYGVMDQIKDPNIKGSCQTIYHAYFSDTIIRPLYIHNTSSKNRKSILKDFKINNKAVSYNRFNKSKGVFNKLICCFSSLPVPIADIALKSIFSVKRILRTV